MSFHLFLKITCVSSIFSNLNFGRFSQSFILRTSFTSFSSVAGYKTKELSLMPLWEEFFQAGSFMLMALLWYPITRVIGI